MSRVLLVAWLTLVWVLLWGSPTPANLLSGLTVALVLVVVFPPGADRGVGLHPVAVLRYGVHFGRELVTATASVAATVLRPRMGLEQGIVAVPLRSTSPVVVSFVANSISLTPGTLTVDVRPRRFGIDDGHHDEPPTLYVHTLIVGDPDHVRADAHRLEELAVAALGTPADRAAVLRAGPPAQEERS